MTIIVNVVCFDLPAANAASVAKAAGGELYEDGEGASPPVIRMRVQGRKAPPAVRKATQAVRDAMVAELGPGVYAALPIVEED